MSAPISNHLFASKAAAAAQQAELEDGRLISFLAKLAASEIPVTDWEEKFCADVLARHVARRQCGQDASLTQCQRDVIKKLVKTYEPQMPFKPSDKSAPSDSPLPAAKPGFCGWLTRGEDGRQTRCGQPAVVRSPRGMEFCQDHHEVRLAWRKRQKEMRGRP